MRSGEGVIGIHPEIKKLGFDQKGKMSVYLQDGRVILIPLKLFPSIARLTPAQRKKYTIGNGEIIVFQDADEIYHIEQFLGRPEDYQYNFS